MGGIRQYQLPTAQASPRLFCFVITQPKHHASRTLLVKRTWGAQCDGLVFVTTTVPPGLRDEIVLAEMPNGKESREGLWAKSKAGWEAAYARRGDGASAFDWFIKADDDTYVSIPRLKAKLGRLDPGEHHFIGLHWRIRLPPQRSALSPHAGNRFTRGSGPSWASGGAGYVLSRRSLERLGSSMGFDGPGPSAWAQDGKTTAEDKLFAEVRRPGAPTGSYGLKQAPGRQWLHLGWCSPQVPHRTTAETPPFSPSSRAPCTAARHPSGTLGQAPRPARTPAIPGVRRRCAQAVGGKAGRHF